VTGKRQTSDLYKNAALGRHAVGVPPNRRERGHPPAAHKFKVGQTLQFAPSIFESAARKGSYTVVSLLPPEGGQNQYRLKSDSDGHERVVHEGQLSV
jgi:hypothetical protein